MRRCHPWEKTVNDIAIKTLVFLLAPILLIPMVILIILWVIVAWLLLPFATVVRTGKGISFRYPW
jgi:hypothetical protein